MAENTLYETVHVTVAPEFVTVRYADGAEAQLALDALKKSVLLHQMVRESEQENQISLKLLQGTLQAWIEAMDAVHVSTKGLLDGSPPKARKPYPGHKRLLQWLEAADFLQDAATAKAICSKASTILFQLLIEHGEESVDTDLAQEMQKLPCNLQQAVLAECTVPPTLQIACLPTSLHQNALHAAFPSITTTNMITAHCPMSSSPEFWQLLGLETGLTSIKLTHELQDEHLISDPTLSDEFLSCMSKLSRLQSLAVPNLKLSNEELKKLLGTLSCQEHLQYLDVSGNARDLQRSMFERPKLYDTTDIDYYDDDEESANSSGHGESNRFQENSEQSSVVHEHAEHFSIHLAIFSALRNLNISRVQLADADVKTMGPSLTNLTSLQTLNLSDCMPYVSRDAVNDFGVHLSCLNSLTALYCCNNGGTAEFFRSLSACTNLQRLEVPTLKHHEYEKSHAAESLSKLSKLQELRFPSRGLCDRDLRGLAAHITSLTCLTALHMVYNSSEEEFALIAQLASAIAGLQDISVHMQSLAFEEGATNSDLAKLVCNSSQVSRLAMCGIRFHPGALDALFSNLKSPAQLCTLQLEGMALESNAAKDFSVVLSQLSSLQHLSLRGNELTDSCFELLAPHIGALPAITNLCLGQNLVGIQGVLAVGRQFINMHSLKELDLSHIRMLLPGASALAAFLSSLTALTCLRLHSAHLGDKGVTVLAAPVGTLTQLQSLCVSCNYLTNKACLGLSMYMSRLINLEHLDVSDNRIDDEGALHLTRCARTLPALRVIDLYENIEICCEDELRNEPCFGLVLIGVPP